jgi:hypothetical protein
MAKLAARQLVRVFGRILAHSEESVNRGLTRLARTTVGQRVQADSDDLWVPRALLCTGAVR